MAYTAGNPAFRTVIPQMRGAVGIITFNRPEKLNALNREMVREVRQALDLWERDDAVRVVVIRGSGRAFSAGADLSPDGATIEAQHSVPEDEQGIVDSVRTWLAVWHYPKPVIAQVHGYCLGGGAHAASFCDLILVAEDAVIGWPRLPVGGGFISPIWSWFVGPRRAKEFSFLVGTSFSGVDAARMGWANQAVPADALESRVMEVARRIALVPTDLLRIKKRALNAVMDMRGFSLAAELTGAWDAVAHASPNVARIRQQIQVLGLHGTIRWFDQGGLSDDIASQRE